MCIWMHFVSFISILLSMIMNMLQCKRNEIQSKQIIFTSRKHKYTHKHTHRYTHTHTQTQIVAWLHIKV